ncbi:hypothetical protein F4678DRAFT_27054 [Xylaria arbuscula]|nr:hypothetical protein F4678DRAFT_27054 [Xylaria arbuscula]
MFSRLNTQFIEHQISILLLCITLLLLSVTTLPPSTSFHLVRAEYAKNSNDTATSTVWLGIHGYCKTDNSNDALNHTHSATQCFSSLSGYRSEEALKQGDLLVGASNITAPGSTHSTRAIIVANVITMAFSLASAVAHHAILQKPTPPKYAAMFICSVIAFTSSLLTFTLATAFSYGVKFGNPSPGFIFPSGYWDLEDLELFFLIAMLFLSSANIMGFFSLIGAKYKCEGYDYYYSTIDDLEQDMNPRLHRHVSSSEGKYPLLS